MFDHTPQPPAPSTTPVAPSAAIHAVRTGDPQRSSRVPGGPRTMTAVVHAAYGDVPEDVLRVQQVRRPEVRTGEVLVRVRAASVDRGTWHVMAGLPYPIRVAGFGLRRPKFLNPGRSLAGTVEALGDGVTGFEPGEEVYGISPGSFAEYVAVQPGKLARKPSNLTFEEAAAVPISGLTALQAVRDHGRVEAGQQVLVLGASGGVGSFAVQIAKAFGAEVTGVSGTASQEAVRRLGADQVLDYTRADPTSGEHTYDVILDIGGNRALSELRRALKPTGRLVIVGGETGGRWLGGTDRQIRAQLVSVFVGQKLGTFVAAENAADLRAMGELIEAGRIRPLIDRIYELRDAAAAVRRMVDGHPRGKIVVNVSDPDNG
jgi:NADPH:quinone reductase-like Zn-dependent oxidoreductase